MASLFLSHSSADHARTQALAASLRAEGFAALFVDFDPVDGIPAGRVWERELYAQLRKADAMVFVGSPDSVASRWCAVELALALVLGKPVFPVLVAGSERHPMLSEVQWVDATADEATSWARLVDGLRRAGIDPTDSFAWDPSRSPYPGLEAFGADDAAVFFGRREETARLVDALQLTPQRDRGRFIAVVGPSGGGKSSLVRAGLVPRLQRQRRWVVLGPMVPGEHPIANLARSLTKALADRNQPVRREVVEASLRNGSATLVELARDLCDASLVIRR